MTRIISGFAGSITLATPSSGTRPTSDMVREALFSALDARGVVDGASVLDLYAGTGALGLEAASRGASTVTLVESGQQAVRACRTNAAAVLKQAPAGSQPTIDVSAQSVQSFLSGTPSRWELVVLDPPYELAEAELARDLELLVARLADGALVLVERSSRSPQPTLPEGLSLDRQKNYGDTTVWWLTN